MKTPKRPPAGPAGGGSGLSRRAASGGPEPWDPACPRCAWVSPFIWLHRHVVCVTQGAARFQRRAHPPGTQGEATAETTVLRCFCLELRDASQFTKDHRAITLGSLPGQGRQRLTVTERAAQGGPWPSLSAWGPGSLTAGAGTAGRVPGPTGGVVATAERPRYDSPGRRGWVCRVRAPAALVRRPHPFLLLRWLEARPRHGPSTGFQGCPPEAGSLTGEACEAQGRH